MSLAAVLVFGAVIAAAAALRELGAIRAEVKVGENVPAADRGSRNGRHYAHRLIGWMAELPFLGRSASTERLARAGGAGGMTREGLAFARLAMAAVCAVPALFVAAALPGRFLPLTVALGIGLGLLVPDFLLERAAARRRRRILAALPDTIDIFAVAAAGGRGLRASISDIARGGSGPLAKELALVVVEIESGSTTNEALRRLRERLSGPELATLTLAIERSARLGSPLSEGLHRQAGSLRDSRRRRLGERAARAAPKIQLVIALVLVPSVLLLIAAGLAAHAESFFSAL